MLDATASSPSYLDFATGYGFTRDKSLWYFSQYLPGGIDRGNPRVSPLFEPDLSGLPPTLAITAECDPLRDEGERYADAIRAAGGGRRAAGGGRRRHIATLPGDDPRLLSDDRSSRRRPRGTNRHSQLDLSLDDHQATAPGG